MGSYPYLYSLKKISIIIWVYSVSSSPRRHFLSNSHINLVTTSLDFKVFGNFKIHLTYLYYLDVVQESEYVLCNGVLEVWEILIITKHVKARRGNELHVMCMRTFFLLTSINLVYFITQIIYLGDRNAKKRPLKKLKQNIGRQNLQEGTCADGLKKKKKKLIF